MDHAARIFGTHWFHRRFTLTPEGNYTTVTELAEWARGPYDNLRKNLLLHGTDAAAPRVILLAPARHGDGTTTTAALLGASFATTHRGVLIDLNFRRPGLAATLGLDGAPGLGAVLRHGAAADVERAILPTRIPNLFALPNAVEGTQRALPEVTAIEAIVRQIRERFDYVVIDAAPVLEYPDTALFAPLADAALLVVAADSTPVDSGLEARRELERSETPVLGAILTRQRRFVPDVIARRLGASAH
jgi:succinoglycan biosynthesis transport protein ExoP